MLNTVFPFTEARFVFEAFINSVKNKKWPSSISVYTEQSLSCDGITLKKIVPTKS